MLRGEVDGVRFVCEGERGVGGRLRDMGGGGLGSIKGLDVLGVGGEGSGSYMR